jgi:hypothetical protein
MLIFEFADERQYAYCRNAMCWVHTFTDNEVTQGQCPGCGSLGEHVANRFDPRPCKGRNANVCVAEGCFNQACISSLPPNVIRRIFDPEIKAPSTRGSEETEERFHLVGRCREWEIDGRCCILRNDVPLSQCVRDYHRKEKRQS